MAHPARTRHQRPALDGDQAAALARLRAAFGAAQVTVTSIHSTIRPAPDPDPATAAAQPTLLEEASCTSTCT
jgi:hypothetical protein